MDEIKERDPAEMEPEPLTPDEEERPDWLVVVQFFIIPLAVIAAAAGVFFLFGMLTQESKSAAEYLAEVRTGSKTRRYQAAYELSKYLVYNKEEARAEPGFAAELGRVFAELDEGQEIEVRRYLALALGHMADPRTLDALVTGLEDSDAQTRIYSVWALGAIGDPRAVEGLLRTLRDPDPGVRKIAAHVLGTLGGEGVGAALHEVLGDPVVDVRWNAALALGRLGDPAGRTILHRMLDRQYLAGVEGLKPEQKREAMVNAIRALEILGGSESIGLLRELGRRDEDLEVRATALSALETLGQGA